MTTAKGGHPSEDDRPDHNTSDTQTIPQETPDVESVIDPFDPAALRASGDSGVVLESILTTVPVRKSKRDEYFRVHPGKDYTMDADVIEVESDMDRETYIVPPAYAHLVLGDARRVRIFTVMTHRGTVILWPAKLPVEGNSANRYSETALKVAKKAESVWVKMWGDRSLGGYAMKAAHGSMDDPKWPDISFRDLLALGFENRIIDSPDHPVIRALNGDF